MWRRLGDAASRVLWLVVIVAIIVLASPLLLLDYLLFPPWDAEDSYKWRNL